MLVADSLTIVSVLFLLIALAVSIGTAVICLLKAKYWTFVAGLFIGLFWVVGAIRLAKPSSWWARRYYDGAKMALAVQRHGA